MKKIINYFNSKVNENSIITSLAGSFLLSIILNIFYLIIILFTNIIFNMNVLFILFLPFLIYVGLYITLFLNFACIGLFTIVYSLFFKIFNINKSK